MDGLCAGFAATLFFLFTFAAGSGWDLFRGLAQGCEAGYFFLGDGGVDDLLAFGFDFLFGLGFLGGFSFVLISFGFLRVSNHLAFLSN